jgi:hypothetical protein
MARAAYHAAYAATLNVSCRLSPDLVNRVRYRLAWGAWPDRANPRTFDEKLQWLNLLWRHPLMTRCGDKFAMRGFVEECHLERLLPRLHGVYSSASEIDVESLPAQFVLKCSHGCKCNVFCLDKHSFDWRATKRALDGWLKTDFSLKLGELHYGQMKPRIICEELLKDDTGGEFPTDYKVLCFNGKAHCTMVAQARDANGIARLAFYDREWKRKLPYCIPELMLLHDVPPPSAYAEMIECAETLSRQLPFVRVDFYSVGGRALLGEMTLTPGACVSANYLTVRAQEELGCLLALPPRPVGKERQAKTKPVLNGERSNDNPAETVTTHSGTN